MQRVMMGLVFTTISFPSLSSCVTMMSTRAIGKMVWAMTTRMDPARDTTMSAPIDYLTLLHRFRIKLENGLDANDGLARLTWWVNCRDGKAVKQRVDSLG